MMVRQAKSELLGSWILEETLHLILNMDSYTLLTGSRYITSPKKPNLKRISHYLILMSLTFL